MIVNVQPLDSFLAGLKKLANGIYPEERDLILMFGDLLANVNTLMNSITQQNLINAKLAVVEVSYQIFVASTVIRNSKTIILFMNWNKRERQLKSPLEKLICLWHLALKFKLRL